MIQAADSLFQKGVAALREGRMEEADGAFRNVLDGDPDHAPALYNLGLICYQGNKTEDASRFLTRGARAAS